MSDSPHLLLPFAAGLAEGCRQALHNMQLPQLARLLARWTSSALSAGDEHSLSPPHERALGAQLGLRADDGCLPWAACERLVDGQDPGAQAWAWITPCHWRVGTDHVRMDDPAALALDEPESRALLALLQPYFEEDGIRLHYAAPQRWLAESALFRSLPAASLDRVIGRELDSWMPRTPEARLLRRLQSETQMLLYTHAISEARAARNLLPVNSFWVSGAGALPPGGAPFAAPAQPPAPHDQVLARIAAAAGVHVLDSLRASALAGDWQAWAHAWTTLDQASIGPLLAAGDRGLAVSLTLCGERSARRFEPAARGLTRRIGELFGRGPRVADLLLAL